MQFLPEWRFATFAVLLLAGVRPLPAQSPAQRAAIEAFRDTIGTADDSVALLAMEARGIMHARHELRDSAVAHVRLGFIALRLGDLAGHTHFDDAASEFQWAIDLQPRWPYGWFGLGLAELGIGDAQFALLRGLQTALGKDARTRSANDFAQSAAVDPSFVRGIVELGNTALLQRVNLRLGVALDVLRRAAATPAGSNPEVELVRARVEREIGSPDSALAAVDALLLAQPSDPVALLELARVRFALGDVDGNGPWYRGLASADTAAIAQYRHDLRFILPDSTLHTFDGATPAQRVSLMRRFWSMRDDEELRATGTRLMEHYHRLAYARRAYRVATIHRHYDIVERYRPAMVDFDDRGVIYIRHGAPDDRVSLDLPGVPFNESWVYHRPGRADLLFHFVAREDVTDYRLVESALDILGFANALRLEGSGDVQGNDAPVRSHAANRTSRISSDSAAALIQGARDAAMSNVAEEIFRSRLPLNPVYQRLLSSGRGGAGGLLGEERALGSHSIGIGTTTDDWQRHYARELPATIQVYALAGEGGRAQVQLAYAVPADPVRRANGALRVRASAVALDGTHGVTLDSVVAGCPVTTRNGEAQVVGSIAMPVSAGEMLVRVGAEAGQSGVTSGRDTLRVSAPSGPVLAMSDIVLGRRDLPLWWIAPSGDTVRADPAAEFVRGVPMLLFAQVFGMRADSTYRVDLVVRRAGRSSMFRRLADAFGASRVALRISFMLRGAAQVDALQREISLASLRPGRYIMQVSVSSTGGEHVARHQDFTVVR